MQQVLRREAFEFAINRDFQAVIWACRQIKRKGQNSTWITDDIQEAYLQLHRLGIAVSAEAWHGGELCGGLYGVLLGNVFFGESMFSRISNASKFAFIRLVGHLQQEGIQLIDCQVYTQHLETLGARSIPRSQFIQLLYQWCG
jgi:leucyl/phenylalanyl-tRNA--protein transferase